MSITRYPHPGLRRILLAGGELPPYLAKHKRASYIRAIILSAPEWVDTQQLRLLDREARWKTVVTGIDHVLDHIIPITHPLVCGLTVPWNLQVIDRLKNAKNGNKLHPAFQEEMFMEPEQLELL